VHASDVVASITKRSIISPKGALARLVPKEILKEKVVKEEEKIEVEAVDEMGVGTLQGIRPRPAIGASSPKISISWVAFALQQGSALIAERRPRSILLKGFATDRPGSPKRSLKPRRQQRKARSRSQKESQIRRR
jgi:hypothetical protein